MSYTMRSITRDEFPAFTQVHNTAFGEHASAEELDVERQGLALDRTLAVMDGDQIVATALALNFELTVPGPATVPAAGITAVGVLPTYRRRGLLRLLMQRQLDDVYARGEALAVLTASESSIYGRFGYGVATSTMSVAIDRRHSAYARPFDPPGRLVLADAAMAASVLPDIYERARRRQPGALARSATLWEHMLGNPTAPLDGAGPRFVVLYESASGQFEGFATYRIRAHWDAGVPNNRVVVRELRATTDEGMAALWRYCLDLDLTVAVEAAGRPVDEPLRWLLADPRHLRVTRFGDDLWLRILDVSRALAARAYGSNDRLRLGVVDPFRPRSAGCYELVAEDGGVSCRRTDTSPDLTLDVADLAATYLGGVRFSTLARAGRVAEHRGGALRRADALFASEPAPWCATGF